MSVSMLRSSFWYCADVRDPRRRTCAVWESIAPGLVYAMASSVCVPRWFSPLFFVSTPKFNDDRVPLSKVNDALLTLTPHELFIPSLRSYLWVDGDSFCSSYFYNHGSTQGNTVSGREYVLGAKKSTIERVCISLANEWSSTPFSLTKCLGECNAP